MTQIELAALNNAYLYEAVCSAHGCPTDFSDFLMLCKGTPPRFYSQAVTLMEGAEEAVQGRVTGGFKDSFYDVDPGDDYGVLFEASWIWRESAVDPSLVFDWDKATTDAELAEWESGWARGDGDAKNFPRQFPASLLERSDVSFYRARRNGEVVGGAIFNLSPGVVGVSNVYVSGVSQEELYRDLAALASSTIPERPIVGYERGDSLDAAVAAGFQALAPLRIWFHR